MSGFVMVPDWLLTKKPSGNAMLAYLNLARRGTFRPGPGVYDECRPRLATLAADMGVSVSTAQRAVDELVELGGVRRRLRFAEDGGQLPTVYTVIFGGVVEPRTPQGDEPDDQGGVVTDEQGGWSPVTNNQEPFTQKEKETSSLSPPSRSRAKVGRASQLPDDFVVTDEMKTWARESAPNCGVEDHEEFCDYWRGNGRPMKDWLATWRNWMRKANREKYRRPLRQQQFKTAHEKRKDSANDTRTLIQQAMDLVASRGGDSADNGLVYEAMQEIKARRYGAGAEGSMLRQDNPLFELES